MQETHTKNSVASIEKPLRASLDTRVRILGTTTAQSKARFLTPVLLSLIFIAQCEWFIATQSITFDEPYNVFAGLQAWRSGQFKQLDNNPPMARLLLALPLLAVKPQPGIQEFRPFTAPAFRPGPKAWAWRVRSVNVLLGLLLGWLLWMTARWLFSEAAANLAFALFAFSPSIIAHFSLANADGAGTLMIFAAVVQLARWWRAPIWRETILLGIILGLMLVSKHNAPPLFVLALGCVLTLKQNGYTLKPSRWNWTRAATVALIAFLIVWAIYFFHTSKILFQNGQFLASFPSFDRPVVRQIRTPVNLTLYVPAGEYFRDLIRVARDSREGFASFFLGEASATGGWKLYFPVVAVLKWPTSVLLLSLVAVFIFVRWLRRPRELLLIMLFPVLFFSIAVFSKFNIGERHILAVYPFLLLVGGAAWEFGRSRRGVHVLLVAVVLIQAADVLRYAPDYLSYFNVFVRPEESFRLLSDSNLDWGQGLIALQKYQQQHPNEEIHLAYFGSVDPAVYGIRAQRLEEDQRVSGTVVVSATHLTGQYLKNPNGYRWLLRYPRKAILNHTLHVFEVPHEPTPR